ncbi:vitamin K epoxide reductase family protein [Microcella frigidaquae]|uniref:Putative membrane protein n=1 Tax=Microcella frigidaquae TaxID=424758 RepID=A0A840XIF5_9MICO|nr:vitamin K epoxide reductase family protein [Microcella frigidaquae]MBB5618272.1 putative membrane protein [Microcella frigidaquae]NHN45948.1 vitamin K epoxide reductase family protein [Microcella frigidaquae]
MEVKTELLEHSAPPGASSVRPLRAFAVMLIVGGVVGWIASTLLLVERIRTLQDPAVTLSCDINPFVSCGALFDRWQASLLGFPNPIIGVAGFVVPVVVGLVLLAGGRFAPWFWRAFVLGHLGAWAFVTWLFVQSTFVIGVLCPYCLVVWAATIPLWWATVVVSLSHGAWGNEATRSAGRILAPHVLTLVFANYAVIVIAIVLEFPAIFAS